MDCGNIEYLKTIKQKLLWNYNQEKWIRRTAVYQHEEKKAYYKLLNANNINEMPNKLTKVLFYKHHIFIKKL